MENMTSTLELPSDYYFRIFFKMAVYYAIPDTNNLDTVLVVIADCNLKTIK